MNAAQSVLLNFISQQTNLHFLKTITRRHNNQGFSATIVAVRALVGSGVLGGVSLSMVWAGLIMESGLVMRGTAYTATQTS